MDATAGSKKAPPAAAAANDDDAVPSATQPAAKQSSSPPPESDATVAGCGEDDDEQVERFYALLDNIRAMRGMVGSGTAAGRKRARDTKPPWRPAFRMEDFELEEEVDSDSAGCAGEKKKKRESSAKWRADDEENEEGEVVEAKGPRRPAGAAAVAQGASRGSACR